MLKLIAAFNQALTEAYGKDPSAPSLIMSYLPNKRWYCSVVRYRNAFGGQKQVVVNRQHAELPMALRELATAWLTYEEAFPSALRAGAITECGKRRNASLRKIANEPLPILD